MSDSIDGDDDLAGHVGGTAYQVIGALANAAGLFDHPEVQRALDYFGYEEWRRPGADLLPWGVGLSSKESAEGSPSQKRPR